MAVSTVKWWPVRINPIHRLDLLHASETFFSWCSCARAEKMRKYKKKRKEILEVWDFSARCSPTKVENHILGWTPSPVQFSTSFSMLKALFGYTVQICISNEKALFCVFFHAKYNLYSKNTRVDKEALDQLYSWWIQTGDYDCSWFAPSITKSWQKTRDKAHRDH